MPAGSQKAQTPQAKEQKSDKDIVKNTNKNAVSNQGRKCRKYIQKFFVTANAVWSDQCSESVSSRPTIRFVWKEQKSYVIRSFLEMTFIDE